MSDSVDVSPLPHPKDVSHVHDTPLEPEKRGPPKIDRERQTHWSMVGPTSISEADPDNNDTVIPKGRKAPSWGGSDAGSVISVSKRGAPSSVYSRHDGVSNMELAVNNLDLDVIFLCFCSNGTV